MPPFDNLPRVACGPGYQLLQGVRVLDFTGSVSGPYATMMLADMGAEVIKVERRGRGDDCRHWVPPTLDGVSLWFLSVNRNKQSIALDFASADGQAVLQDLIKACDALVCNQPLRVQQKLGFDYDSAARLRPDIVHAAITGFGLTGERADWPGYDLIAEGYGGIMDMTGEPDGEAQKVGAPAADMLAGMDAAFAVVAALYDRRRTGSGHQIDVSLVESMARFLTPWFVDHLGSGAVHRRSGGRASVIAIYQAFETADDPMTLGLGNDTIWRRFWDAVGDPDYGARPEYATNAGRREHRLEIVAHVQALLRTRGRADWLALCQAARVPAGPINRVDEVVEDEHLLERGFFFTADDGRIAAPTVGTGIRIDDAANVPRHNAPALGQHSEAVLSQILGYDAARIQGLKDKKVIQGS